MKEELRIAIFHDLPSGGAKRCLFEYCRNLSRRGIILDAYLPATANEEFLPLDEVLREKMVFPASRDYLLPPGAKRGALKRLSVFIKAILDNMEGQKKIAESINDKGYDLAFIHHSQFIQSPFILRYLKIPSVYFMHEPYRAAYDEFTMEGLTPKVSLIRRLHIELFRRMDSRNAHHASMVLANSRFSQERIYNAYGIRADVCYLGINTDMFHPMRGVEKQDFVLSVGSLRPHKGHRFVIDSLALLSPENRPRLLIVADSIGRGERDLVLRAAHEKEVEVEVLVDIPDERLRLLYNQARLVAFAPYKEPFGFVPLESMACGTPVVGVREGGLVETIEDGVTGFLVERDPGLFSLAVSRLLSNPDLSRRMGMQGVRMVREKWSWEKSGDALLEYFRQVLSTRRTQDGDPRTRP